MNNSSTGVGAICNITVHIHKLSTQFVSIENLDEIIGTHQNMLFSSQADFCSLHAAVTVESLCDDLVTTRACSAGGLVLIGLPLAGESCCPLTKPDACPSLNWPFRRAMIYPLFYHNFNNWRSRLTFEIANYTVCYKMWYCCKQQRKWGWEICVRVLWRELKES